MPACRMPHAYGQLNEFKEFDRKIRIKPETGRCDKGSLSWNGQTASDCGCLEHSCGGGDAKEKSIETGQTASYCGRHMLKYLIRGLLSGIAFKLLDNYRRLSIQLLKIEAAKSYLHGVRMARLSMIGLMRMWLLIALICIGALLLHAGVLILLPWSVEAKAVLAVIMGLAYVVVGGVMLRASLDEKTWMEKSGAARMLDDATGQSKP